MQEEWRPVVGWEDLYEVTNTGRVRSVPHVTPGRPLRNGYVMMPFKGKEIFGNESKSGHITMALNKGPRSGRRTVYLHVLVLEAFAGPRPPGMIACHYDDNPKNNNIENLRWDTISANTYDKVRNGRHAMASRTHCPHGHEYTPENTYMRTAGSRQCRTCRNAQRRKAYKDARN